MLPFPFEDAAVMSLVPCPHCGADIEHDASFCRHCGSSDADGWQEDWEQDSYEDEFDYDSYVDQHHSDRIASTELPTHWRFVAVLMLVCFLIATFWWAFL